MSPPFGTVVITGAADPIDSRAPQGGRYASAETTLTTFAAGT
ncbi:hypothetical protein ACQP08_16630 [Micromonospora zamorensis]